MGKMDLLVALIMVAGLIGIVIPLLPGLLLVWAAVLLWATEAQSTGGWVILGIATVLALCGSILQYVLPGRRMARAGVRTSSTLAGAALGFVGFFVLPIIGAPLGFALGIYLAERVKLGSHVTAWPSTRQALKAIALSVGIELLTGLAIATTWLIGLGTTG
jgi:uncharacterized protein YqgC (DUF456 family)